MGSGSILKRSAAAFAALLVAASATPGAAQQDADGTDAPRGPRTCLPHPMIDRTKVLNGKNIVFVTHDDTIYSNELPKQCPSLRRNSLVNYGIANGRVCAGDTFQVLWEVAFGNYVPASLCRLGTFVPITAAELEDLMTMTAEDGDRRRARRRSTREGVTTEQVELPPQADAEPAPLARAE